MRPWGTFAMPTPLTTAATAQADEPAHAANLATSLADPLRTIETHDESQVIGAELPETGGRCCHECEMQPVNGLIFSIGVDAASGAVFGTRGPVPAGDVPGTDPRTRN